MNILAFDSATELLMVAARAGGRVSARLVRDGLRHGEILALEIQGALSEVGLSAAELDLVAVGTGPGSFTGVRIGVATAQGIARGIGCRLAGIPTLDALAWPHRGYPGLVVPVIDARKGRAYAAVYRGGVRASDYLDLSPRELADTIDSGQRVLLTGPFAKAAAALLGRVRWELDASSDSPDPAALLELALAAKQSQAPARPTYLRPSEAEYSRHEREPKR